MVLGKLTGGTIIASIQGLLFLVLGLVISPWLGFHYRFDPLSAAHMALFVVAISFALTGLGFVLAWRMDSTQGFHAVMSVLLMPMWLLSGAFFPAESGLLGWIVRLNPLTYGVAGLRRLLYAGAVESEPTGLPSLALCWLVIVLFSAIVFVASCRVARQRTTGDLL